MKLKDVLKENQAYFDIDASSKETLFEFASEKMQTLGLIDDKEMFIKDLYEREAQSPTGMGDLWAIPHAQSDVVKASSVLFVKTKEAISYESLEGDTSQYFFFIAVPKTLASDQVKILSGIANLLMDEDFKASMKDVKDAKSLIALIDQKETKEVTQTHADTPQKRIVAVTACTTGIAHTYMAETALLEAAKKMNIDIYVEKQGAAGVEDALTQDAIDKADAVVLAVEKGINENRFAGKQILKVSPGTAIKQAETVLEDALNHKNTYTKHVDENENSKSGSQPSVKGVYQHLLAGVSYMIPIVVAGGLLIALSFAFGITAFENEGSLPWALFEIGAGSALALMFPVLAGFIAYDIADKPGFAPGIIGGFIAHTSGSGFVGAIIAGYLAGYTAQFINKKIKFPNSIQGLKSIVVLPLLSTLIVGLVLLFVVATPIVALQETVGNFLNSLSSNNAGIVLLSLSFSVLYFDLGGPISKMVYSFAVAMLADNIYTTMSAAMIIGMVPPLGVAIATFIKPNFFKEDEQEAGKTALLLGMSFITEGAIPFAIAHPKQAIPSFMLGGFVGSVISLLFNVGVTAPHGGLFLVFIPNAITNPILFIIALLAGSFVTAISMIFLMSLNRKKQIA